MNLTRVDAPELLDLGIGSPTDVERNLADLWRINRFLGGLTPFSRYLYPRLQAGSLADIGTGSAQIAAHIGKWAEKRRIPLCIWALDLSARNLQVARKYTLPNMRFIQGDVLHLPLAENSVDYVISSLLVHHLTPEQVIIFLKAAFKITRRTLIISDLVRGWLPLIAFKLSQPIFARHYITRYDGAVSIRRAYTPAELAEFAHSAGLTNFQIHRHWAWRMTLVVDK